MAFLRRRGSRPLFADRRDAGRKLATLLANVVEPRERLVVIALPRGGVPVAYYVASALAAPLDILAVRKLGVPGFEELAMGAVAAGGGTYVVESTLRLLGAKREQLEGTIAAVGAELERAAAAYRAGRAAVPIEGRTVILVDDGLATGATMHAAIAAVRRRTAQRIVVAVPVAPSQARAEFAGVELVCCAFPDPFGAVGLWYRDFSQVDDETVRFLLRGCDAHHTEP
jgi:predicted phosphoribosyltransferase